jgi:IMP dehydrogenase
MTPKEKLITVQEGTGLEEMVPSCYEHRIEKMLVVDDAISTCVA